MVPERAHGDRIGWGLSESGANHERHLGVVRQPQRGRDAIGSMRHAARSLSGGVRLALKAAPAVEVRIDRLTVATISNCSAIP